MLLPTRSLHWSFYVYLLTFLATPTILDLIFVLIAQNAKYLILKVLSRTHLIPFIVLHAWRPSPTLLGMSLPLRPCHVSTRSVELRETWTWAGLHAKFKCAQKLSDKPWGEGRTMLAVWSKRQALGSCDTVTLSRLMVIHTYNGIAIQTVRSERSEPSRTTKFDTNNLGVSSFG